MIDANKINDLVNEFQKNSEMLSVIDVNLLPANISFPYVIEMEKLLSQISKVNDCAKQLILFDSLRRM